MGRDSLLAKSLPGARRGVNGPGTGNRHPEFTFPPSRGRKGATGHARKKKDRIDGIYRIAGSCRILSILFIMLKKALALLAPWRYQPPPVNVRSTNVVSIRAQLGLFGGGWAIGFDGNGDSARLVVLD